MIFPDSAILLASKKFVASLAAKGQRGCLAIGQLLALNCGAMLFDAERLHFFRPLTGKYREQIAACLRELYGRLYTSLADYSRVIGRELVLEVFQEAITRSPVLDDAEDDKALPVRDERELAIWIPRVPLELRCACLERNVRPRRHAAGCR